MTCGVVRDSAARPAGVTGFDSVRRQGYKGRGDPMMSPSPANRQPTQRGALSCTMARAKRLDRHFRAGESVVVAVSGGPDSIALLYWLVEENSASSFGLRLHVAHLNHQLRGGESDADAAFVARQAAALGVGASVESRAIASVAESGGMSVEAAGRQERYAFFHRVCLRVGASVVALAHHADDNVETILHRIIRGTGLRGLSGIPESRPLFPDCDIRVVRPFHDVDRATILAYLRERELAFRVDRSNAEAGPTRNRIRGEVLSLLEGINPRSRDAVLRLAEQARWAAEYVHDTAARLLETLVVERGSERIVLDAAGLRSRARILQAEIIRQSILTVRRGERDVSFERLQRCVDLLNVDSDARRISLPGDLRVERCGDRLVIRMGPPARDPVPDAEIVLAPDGRTRLPEFGIEITCETMEVDGAGLAARLQGQRPTVGIPARRCEEWIDANKVEGPLVARRRRRGERFRPFGFPRPKLVSDFLRDARVDGLRRERLVVVADRAGPVWLVDLRIDERVRVTSATTRALRLSATLSERSSERV